ncbi:MAG TPA: hypothetical protein VJH92_05785 [Candidatus Nanoarchaeia archaeon]|nr:hypothetical protein [Candidatus Nanoarchaeia archaeon]
MAKNKQAAMEMSVGTLVTIVLLMVVLVLGIVLVKSIFGTGQNTVDLIDAQVQDQINKLFTDESTKFVILPSSREVRIKQGNTGGVGFSTRNVDKTQGSFTYKTTAVDVEKACKSVLSLPDAQNLINIGGSSLVPYNLASGNKMDEAALIKFSIDKTTPLCLIRYRIEVFKGSTTYGYTDFDLKIIS